MAKGVGLRLLSRRGSWVQIPPSALCPYFPFIKAFSNYYSTASEKGSKQEAELNFWLKGDPIKFQ